MRRAIVVGGSLGGLFAGCNLRKAGWDVTVLERTEGPLKGRGAGLGVHPTMIHTLLAAGAKVDASIGVAVPGRVVFARDGSEMATLRMPQFCISWARLYSALSAVFPEAQVRRGANVVAVEQDADAVTVQLADGAALRAELLVAADGLRSTVRKQFLPEADLVYAGYIAWRGLADEAKFSPAAHRSIFPRFAFAMPEGEHVLGYPVPGEDDDLRPGHRRYNFVWYRPVDAATRLRDMHTDAAGRYYADGIPPQSIRRDVIDAMLRDADTLLCPIWAEAIRNVDQPLFQPIGDLVSDSIAFGRVAVLGDAAFVARPHAAKGAIKAAYDAMALAEALTAESDVVAALKRYDAERRPAGLAVVNESRQLGAYLEGKLGRIRRDPVELMRMQGGVVPSNVDGGLFVRLLAELGYT